MNKKLLLVVLLISLASASDEYIVNQEPSGEVNELCSFDFGDVVWMTDALQADATSLTPKCNSNYEAAFTESYVLAAHYNTRRDCFNDNRDLFAGGSEGYGDWTLHAQGAQDLADAVGAWQVAAGLDWTANGYVCDDEGEKMVWEGEHPDHSGPGGSHPNSVPSVGDHPDHSGPNGSHPNSVDEDYVPNPEPSGVVNLFCFIAFDDNLSDAMLAGNDETWETVCNQTNQLVLAAAQARMDKLSTRAECYGNNRSLFEWGSVGSGIWNTAQTAAHAEMTTLGTFMENYGVFWSSNNLNCNDDLEVIDYEGDHPNHDENGDHAKDVTEVYVAVIDELPHGDLENCDELFVNTNLSDAYTLNANNDLWTTVCNADFSANMEEASAWLSFELDRAGCLATNQGQYDWNAAAFGDLMTDIDLVYDHVDDIGTFMEQYGAHWKVNGKVCDANGDVLTYDESHPDHSGPNGTHPVVVGTVPSNP